jgi:hypothetical protein
MATEAERERYRAAIEAAIAKARASRDLSTVQAFDGAEVYAYPRRECIAWGVNGAESGVNLLRGIRRLDGVDEAVS